MKMITTPIESKINPKILSSRKNKLNMAKASATKLSRETGCIFSLLKSKRTIPIAMIKTDIGK